MKLILVASIVILDCTCCVQERFRDNNLAIIELVRQKGTETVFLPNDYGFLILWIDHRKPNLYLYDKPAGEIRMTTDFSVFLAGLEGLPNGAKVDRIRGCGISSQGTPEEEKRPLQQLIKVEGFYLTGPEDGNYGLCTCETSNVHFFTTANNKLQFY